MHNLVEWYYENTNYPLDKTGTYFQENINPSFVYVIGNPLNKSFKIGITQDYEERFDNLCNTSGCPLYLLLLIELHYDYDEDSRYVESMLHKYFKTKRIRGEWFKLTTKDLIQIRNLFYKIEGEDVVDDLNLLKDFYSHSSD